MDGIILNFYDTAGLRETKDVVESIGIKKTLDIISKADLILYLLDNSKAIDEEDIEFIKTNQDKNMLLIVNKTDLEEKLDYNLIKDFDILKISTKEENVKNQVLDNIKNKFNSELFTTEDLTYISNSYLLSQLQDCLNSVNDIINGIQNVVPVDIIEIDLKNIWNKLGVILGVTYDNELLDSIFKDFCLGK